MDRALPFYIMVIPAGRAAELKGAESKTWTEEQIRKLNVGYVKLELLPRGSGRRSYGPPSSIITSNRTSRP